MSQTPEGRVKEAVKKLLKTWGIWFYMPVSNGMGVHGIPDLICCYEGLLIGIETKSPLKNPTTEDQRWKKATPNQQNRITEIRNAGGIALVVDDVVQVEELLNAIKPLADLNRNARSLLGTRRWPETIRRSIGTTMELLSRKRSEPCEMPPDEKRKTLAK